MFIAVMYARNAKISGQRVKKIQNANQFFNKNCVFLFSDLCLPVNYRRRFLPRTVLCSPYRMNSDNCSSLSKALINDFEFYRLVIRTWIRKRFIYLCTHVNGPLCSPRAHYPDYNPISSSFFDFDQCKSRPVNRLNLISLFATRQVYLSLHFDFYVH